MNTMQIKPGVKLNGLGSEILIGIMVAKSIYDKYGFDFVITCGTDSKHGYSSEHYKGDAVDIRTRNIPEDKRVMVANEIRKALGIEFDAVLHGTHLHIEYDPK